MSRIQRTSFLLALAVAACGEPATNGDTGTVGDDASSIDGGRDSGATGGDASIDAARTPDGGSGDTGTMLDGSMDDGAIEATDAEMAPDVTDLPDAIFPDAWNIQCGGGQVGCDGVCTDLQNDAENCGECGRTCYGTHVFGVMCASRTCTILSCDPLFGDADRNPDNGCEAPQEFAIELPENDITLNAGGTQRVVVNYIRQGGFPYSISSNILDASALTITSDGPTLDSTTTIGVQAPALTPAGIYTARVIASASVPGHPSITHEAPITIRVVSSPLNISAVDVLIGGVVVPGNQVPQGAGTVTIRVRGTGLNEATGPVLGGLLLSPVAGGTSTERAWTVDVPHGTNLVTNTLPYTLTLNSSGGPATFARALVLSKIAVSPTGNDVSGRGTELSPVQSIARAFQLAGVNDSIWLLGGAYDAPTTVAPAIFELHGPQTGNSVISCASSTGTGLRFASTARVRGVTIEGCGVGIALDSVDQLRLTGVQLQSTTRSWRVVDGSAIDAVGVRSDATDRLVVNGGTLSAHSSTFPSIIETVNATATVVSSNIRGLVLGTGSHSITDTQLGTGTPVGLELRPGATATITRGFIYGSTTAIVIDGASLTTTATYVGPDAGNGIELRGASPSLSMLAGGVRGFGGVGIRVTPASGAATVRLGDTTTSVSVNDNAGGGIDVVNTATTTTDLGANANISLDGNGLFGLRVTGGSTDFIGRLSITTAADDAVGVDLVSGDGMFRPTTGTWTLPRGIGIRLRPQSTHVVAIGTTTSRVDIHLTNHVFDFRFGIEDRRTSAGSPVVPIYANFRGSDGMPRVWSMLYRPTIGSYSMSVTPQDLAAWFVTGQGGLQFR